jgi:hypothetical protein
VVRVALPAEGRVLESGVTLVGRDELQQALSRVQTKPPRPPGPEALPEERELLLEDHMAAAVGPASRGWAIIRTRATRWSSTCRSGAIRTGSSPGSGCIEAPAGLAKAGLIVEHGRNHLGLRRSLVGYTANLSSLDAQTRQRIR